ncbi:hypothetical protein ACGFNU_31395 [Spirillospora sp. NPDC048911]|uniref:hypothetical protein n=1 Tax=Spirillospora sp. NPDC048911 TaxID=3364527 RepID=UPI00371EC158
MSAPPPDGTTVRTERSILAIAHTVTSTTRLLDVLATFDGDHRLQLFLTTAPGATAPDGVSEFLADLEVKAISWNEAIGREFDLALAAASSGPLHEINAPLVSFPHGAGYNKYLQQKAESRKQKAESRKRKAEGCLWAEP